MIVITTDHLPGKKVNSMIMGGAAELLAYGTAVLLEDE
jgi:uncharacterized protein YbjQ (UPF0145 family)